MGFGIEKLTQIKIQNKKRFQKIQSMKSVKNFSFFTVCFSVFLRSRSVPLRPILSQLFNPIMTKKGQPTLPINMTLVHIKI